MASAKSIKWLKQVDKEDFAAARSYLELLYPPEQCRSLVRGLRSARIRRFPAKDILRASELTVLDAKEPNVARQFKKLRKGEGFSPLLLVRERGGRARVIVADGFHRLCVAMHVDESGEVPCKLA